MYKADPVETNIQKMQALLETVATGSFTRAAEKLSYSQSGVSRMVSDLEADWGFRVLERSRDGVTLTADGEQVLPAVEALCNEFAQLRARVDEVSGLMRGQIRIGTFSSVATHWLPHVIGRFQKDYSGIEYELLMGDYTEIESWVADGRCDLGFLPREPRIAGVASAAMGEDELLAVVPEGSELAIRESVSLADLARRPFILLERGTDDEISPLFRSAGVTLNARFATWDDYAIMSMVENGLGVSILPALILRRNPYAITALPLNPPVHRSINVIYREGALSLAAATFKRYLGYRDAVMH